MKYILIILSLLGIGLFMSNYSICMYFYPPTEYPTYVEWWALKQNIYNVGMMADKSILFLLTCYFYKVYKIYNFKILSTITLFAFLINLANIIDRLCFNITTYTKSDILMLIFAALISIAFHLLYGRKRANI